MRRPGDPVAFDLLARVVSVPGALIVSSNVTAAIGPGSSSALRRSVAGFRLSYDLQPPSGVVTVTVTAVIVSRASYHAYPAISST